MKKFGVSKLLIWRQKWTAGVRHGTSLVVRRVSSGRPIVVLFWTKYAFPRQIKPGILKVTTSRCHSNLLTAFSFVNCEEEGYYRVVSVGQLSFDCRSYCGRSCRMQGAVWRKTKNISANNEAMLLKLGRDAAPYKIYQVVHILMLLWQHARFQSLPLQNQIFNNYWTRLSKILWFVGGEQINYLPKPKAEANNWSARHWQITIFCDNRVR